MEEHYVDPNSGAAPQPGGYAGPEAAEKGFAIPAGVEVEEEKSPADYEPINPTKKDPSVEEVAAAREANNPPKEKSEEEQQKAEALYAPKKVLADLDEGDSASKVEEQREPGSDEEAVNAAALEHEAVDLENAGDGDDQAAEEGDGDDDEEKGESAQAFNPGDHNVQDVLKYVSENPDQKEAVLAAEKSGKNRDGVVSKLS